VSIKGIDEHNKNIQRNLLVISFLKPFNVFNDLSESRFAIIFLQKVNHSNSSDQLPSLEDARVFEEGYTVLNGFGRNALFCSNKDTCQQLSIDKKMTHGNRVVLV